MAEFLGLHFDRLDQAAALGAIGHLANQDGFSYVVTPNVDHLVRLHRQPDNRPLWDAYARAALTLCDSRILKLLARRSGLQLDLVTGSDLTAQILKLCAGFERIGVVGGTTGLMSELRSLYPGLEWHHHDAPPGVLDNPRAQVEIAEFTEECPARLIFFAIGGPQSELVCSQIAARGKARGVALCIGASLEFITGAKTRAPLWMQQVGLEWLFRLGSEPGRLWRRYLIEGPRIFAIWRRWTANSAR